MLTESSLKVVDAFQESVCNGPISQPHCTLHKIDESLPQDCTLPHYTLHKIEESISCNGPTRFQALPYRIVRIL